MTANLSLIYSGNARRALHMAELAHRGVNRKAVDVPYILHSVVVAQLIAAAGGDDDMICAGYLHDVVEDTDYTLTTIVDEFGIRVATLVQGLTKNPDLHGQEQKDAIREFMETAEIDIVALKGCDMIANVTDLIFDLKHLGWDALNAAFKDLPNTIENYLSLAYVVLTRLDREGAYPLIKVILKERIDQLAIIGKGV